MQDQWEQPKSFADQLREVMQPTYLKQEPETNYLGKVLPDVLNPQIDISDDVDDETIYGRNRHRKGQARTNTR